MGPEPFICYLFERLDVQRVIVEPRVSNHRAIRRYEKAGFRKVRGLPCNEPHEGEYRDSWLMAVERGEG